MTMNAPVSAAASPQDNHSWLRRLLLRGRHWWRDILSLPHRDRTPLALQPFSFWPDHASAIVDISGTEPPVAKGYAFHTNYVPSSGSKVSFRIRLDGLRATSGRLHLAINRLNGQGAVAGSITKVMSLTKLAAKGGEAEISMRGGLGYSYAVLGTVSDDSDARADDIIIEMIGGVTAATLSAGFTIARRDFLSAPASGILSPIIVNRPATLAVPISQMCTAAQMEEPVYAQWCERMGVAPSPHRKQWEFVFICRALEYYGALREGSRGLGFGVGIEPMSSLFAAAGCEIVATDLSAEDDRSVIWNATDQLGANLRQIHRPELCDEATFFERVSYRPVDMTAIPPDLTGFDFTWSSCAYEHLGSIKAGLAFFENSIDCLKPGGIAVHTTELNLSSNGDTLDHGSTVIFRRRDFEALAERLIAQGHDVLPITFDCGDTELDRVIDMPPYSSDSHLRLALLRWVATSFGMIVRKKS
jgi:hypothetical protein